MFNKYFIPLICIILLGCSTKPPIHNPVPTIVLKKDSVPEKINYRQSYTKYFDLIHTRLNVSFNWKKKELIGQAAIILRPHFYSSDSITLNAKGMEIKEVALLSSYGKHIPLKFEYDSLLIKIHLDRTYSKEESYTLFISYISKPEQLSEGGSSAIRSNKGLYFINADSLDNEKPTEVWTQGETESNSVWFPTIDDPGQKMTQEIYITVDTALTTLSNGLLISSTNNSDGTKTDYWKQSLPASPYLTMIAAGKFSVVKERWKNIEVSYYVDPPYEKYAQMVFGKTPEMMTYFSDLLGVPFVWEKYAQIVVHDYISGAMENTTAVVHGTNMQQNYRKYIDGNFENYIAHELFHHWFGDLVTCESWSNITLNEGFANYSEYLWNEYKYGRETADYINNNVMTRYLYSATQNDPPLIRYEYEDREDVYDAISYNKGGRILHMLRKYVGDNAFFASLHLYLNRQMFSTAEADDLRLAFEKTTGEDLNWFFNQWFYKGGHPSLKIDYEWSDSLSRETVTISQKQNFANNILYKLPLDIDLYFNGKIERKKIIVEDAIQKFYFTLPVKPDLVNVDAEKSLLCNKTDNKTSAEFIFQYKNAPLFLDRLEAIDKIGSSYSINTPESAVMLKALSDKSYGIRLSALNNIAELALNDSASVKTEIIKIAVSDSLSDLREKALACLGKYFSYSEFSQLYENALNDSSYKVVARSFQIIGEKDLQKANKIAPLLEKDSSDVIYSRLAEFYSTSDDNKIDFYKKAFKYSNGFSRYQILKYLTKYVIANSNPSIVIAGTNIIMERNKKSPSKRFRTAIFNSLNEIETSFKNKIQSCESEIEKSSDSKIKKEKINQLSELKSLQNKLHESNSTKDK